MRKSSPILTHFAVASTLVILLFTQKIAHAETCVQPTAPSCYSTVPLYSGVGLQSDGAIVSANGEVMMSNGGGIVNSPTKQVQVSCTGTQQDIDYKVAQISYSTCTAINDLQRNSNYSSPTLTTQQCMNMNGPKAIAKNGACGCLDNYTLDISNQCTPTADVCIQQLGPNAIMYKGSCVCDDGYHTDSSAHKCVADAKETIYIPGYIKDWVDENATNSLKCEDDSPFSGIAVVLCKEYQKNKNRFDWQASPQSPTTSTEIKLFPTHKTKNRITLKPKETSETKVSEVNLGKFEAGVTTKATSSIQVIAITTILEPISSAIPPVTISEQPQQKSFWVSLIGWLKFW